MLTYNLPYVLWCTALGKGQLLVLFCLTYVPSNFLFQPVVSGDGAQAGRNHADHHGWEPGPAVQRHPERSPHRQGVLQPSGGPIHQCWAVRCHYLCLHLFTPTPNSQAPCFWDSLLPCLSLSNIDVTLSECWAQHCDSLSKPLFQLTLQWLNTAFLFQTKPQLRLCLVLLVSVQVQSM